MFIVYYTLQCIFLHAAECLTAPNDPKHPPAPRHPSTWERGTLVTVTTADLSSSHAHTHKYTLCDVILYMCLLIFFS